MLGAALALLACGSGEITAVGTTEIGAPPPDSTDTAPPTETGLSATDSGPRTETATPDSATDTAGTEDSATETGPIDTTPPAWCPTVADPVQIGAVIHEDLTELSGVVESRKQPGVLWTHNDSGDTDRFFALSRSGSLLGTFAIDGVHPGTSRTWRSGRAPTARTTTSTWAMWGTTAAPGTRSRSGALKSPTWTWRRRRRPRAP